MNYTIECENPATHKLKIRAKIQGLPAEEIPLLLPDSHVTGLELLTVEGGGEKETEALQELIRGSIGEKCPPKRKAFRNPIREVPNHSQRPSFR